jgi:hypothetical protein
VVAEEEAMERRALLILARAKELLARDHPRRAWLSAEDRPDGPALKRQATFLSLAEDQLLDEGKIECVDQS